MKTNIFFLTLFLICTILEAQRTEKKDNKDKSKDEDDENSKWDNFYIFDGACLLRWKVDVENKMMHLRMESHTPGWIGIGWSPSDGKMQNADMVILTSHEGEYQMRDYHSSGFFTPVLDEHSDIEQVSSGQKRGTTWMEFKRPLTTDDKDDKPFVQGSMKLIWALGRAMDSLEIHSEAGSEDVILWPTVAGDYHTDANITEKDSHGRKNRNRDDDEDDEDWDDREEDDRKDDREDDREDDDREDDRRSRRGRRGVRPDPLLISKALQNPHPYVASQKAMMKYVTSLYSNSGYSKVFLEAFNRGMEEMDKDNQKLRRKEKEPIRARSHNLGGNGRSRHGR